MKKNFIKMIAQAAVALIVGGIILLLQWMFAANN